MPATKDERLNLRLTSGDDALIRAAAETSGTSVNDYVIDSAVQRAQQQLADQRHFDLDAEAWDRFVTALDRPARVNERLAALLARPSLFDEK